MFLQQPIFKTNGCESVFLLVVMFINIDLIPIILLDYISVTLYTFLYKHFLAC